MDEGFSAYLESKQAGPLSCPICGQTNTFEPRGNLAATRAYPLCILSPSIQLRCMHQLRILYFFDAQTTGFLHSLALLEGDWKTGSSLGASL